MNDKEIFEYLRKNLTIELSSHYRGTCILAELKLKEPQTDNCVTISTSFVETTINKRNLKNDFSRIYHARYA